ncbi:MAG: hypothetical protein DMG64_01730 [Acidobacteria bacterium]|nr:MAG: hypothetical protein DMG64_01730 [Acidobacteriota bacterium]
MVTNKDIAASKTIALLFAIAFCLQHPTCSAQAQATNATDVAVGQIFLDVSESSRRSEFEEGMGKHVAWLKANHESWSGTNGKILMRMTRSVLPQI